MKKVSIFLKIDCLRVKLKIKNMALENVEIIHGNKNTA